jgi:hypothetical protein
MGILLNQEPLLTELAKAYIAKAQLREKYQSLDSTNLEQEVLDKMKENYEKISHLICQWLHENPTPEDLIEGSFLLELDKYNEEKDDWHSRLLESDVDEWYKHKYKDYDYEGQPEGLWFYNFPKVMIEELLEDLHSLNSEWMPKEVKWTYDKKEQCPFYGDLSEATDYLEAYGLLEGQKIIKAEIEMFIKTSDAKAAQEFKEGMGEGVIYKLEVDIPIPTHMAGDEDYEKYHVYRVLDQTRKEMIREMLGFNITFPNGDFSD